MENSALSSSVGNVTIRLLPLAALSLSVGGCATTGSPPLQMSVPVAVALSHVPKANPSAYGVTMPNRLSPQLAEVVVAQGSMAMENVSREFARYGYNGDGPLIAPIGISQSGSVPTEATKTEPDKNVYLVLTNQHGPDSSYNYGTHSLSKSCSAIGRDQLPRDVIPPITLTNCATIRIAMLSSC